jgi:hypothetical protein
VRVSCEVRDKWCEFVSTLLLYHNVLSLARRAASLRDRNRRTGRLPKKRGYEVRRAVPYVRQRADEMLCVRRKAQATSSYTTSKARCQPIFFYFYGVCIGPYVY